MRRAALVAASWTASFAAACGGTPKPGHAERATTEPELGALARPRWAYTERAGVKFDEGAGGALLPRAEPAVVGTTRVILEGGVVVASAHDAIAWGGHRAVPGFLGGGLVLWSDQRVFLAKSFLDDPSAWPSTPVRGEGGVRPWLSTLLVNGAAGLFEIDPRALASGVRRAALPPGTAMATAVSPSRAARLDAFGRASFTIDGGASWTDVLATRGMVTRSIYDGPAGSIIFAGATNRVLALRDAGLVALENEPQPETQPMGRPAGSRSAAADMLGQAIATGALLPADRVVVARDGGVRLLSLRSGLPIADTDLPSIDPKALRCQAFDGGPSGAALVCAADTGAAVIDLDGSLARPMLEATFPTMGASFVGGPRGRLAYEGYCSVGSASADLAAPVTHPPDDDDDGGVAPDAGAIFHDVHDVHDDDERVCVRAAPAHWIEHRVLGEDARHLYRWVPGEGADVTALVLTGGNASASPTVDGLRILRVSAEDPALAGAIFPTVFTAHEDPPHTVVDVDFWEAGDRSIHGWVRLPPADGPPPAAPRLGGARRLPSTFERRAGLVTGVRIGPDARVTLYPLPDGVTEVVTGGRFGLAMGFADETVRWYETTDGGASWAIIEGPPDGTIDPPADVDPAFGCSAMGCVVASGVVRIGWGPSPTAIARPRVAPAEAAKPDRPSIALVCRFDRSPPFEPLRSSDDAPPEGLLVPGKARGKLTDHTWRAKVVPPFQPTAAPRTIAITDATLEDADGYIAPVLALDARSPIDAMVILGKHRLRVGGARSFIPFDVSPSVHVAADLPGGLLVSLATDSDASLWMTRGNASSQILKVTRVPSGAKVELTLGRIRSSPEGLALVGYSTESGEVFAGSVDLGRAEVAPLTRLGRIDALLGAGACGAATHRFVLPTTALVRFGAGAASSTEDLDVLAVIDADADHACVVALEARVGSRDSDFAYLRATLGKGGVATIGNARGACSIEQNARIDGLNRRKGADGRP